MAKESAQKGHFYVLQLNSHRITLNTMLQGSKYLKMCRKMYYDNN